MNIKSEEAHELAREVALFTGESQTTAVTTALRERLARLHATKSPRTDRLLAIGRDCAAHLSDPFRTVDHGDLLYDKMGIPQ